MLRAIREQRYDNPTPVQREAIPAVLSGEDLLAAAQTGTGKTAGFTLPLLQRLMETRSPRSRFRSVRALVLVPTRELALQVSESMRTYGAHLPIRCTAIFGGVGMGAQLDALRAGREVVVATPGRLLDHLGRGTVDLGRIEVLVLDEADRMLDMGFINDIKRVLSLLPRQRQTLLFSATFSDPIRALADRLLNRPRSIQLAPRNSAADTVAQVVYRVDKNRKSDVLADLIHRGGWKQVLVFTRTKRGASNLARRLERAQLTATAIHGNRSQSARTRALASFKQGEVRVLVATDIAARGLDIDGLPHVVNYELPNVSEDYVHRIGRTGRAGASGEAVSLVCVEEAQLLRDVEKLLRRRLPVREPAGLELDSETRPTSIGPQSGGGARGRARAQERPAPRRARRKPGGASPSVRRNTIIESEEMTMAIGNVKWFNPAKGFGFIAPEDTSKDVFIHISALERAGISALAEGQKIEYELGAGRDGRTSAENIRLLD